MKQEGTKGPSGTVEADDVALSVDTAGQVYEAPGASMGRKSKLHRLGAATGPASAAVRIIASIGRSLLDLVVFFIFPP